MKWFGRSWGAPICTEEHAPTPIGHRCVQCRESVMPDAQGLLIPHCEGARTRDGAWVFVERPWHIDCWLRHVGAKP